LYIISQKWSQVSKRTPEPFCPYIYLHEISQQELIDLKNELHQEGFKFKDGFDFSGAAFSPKSISEMNKAAPVCLKILNESSHVGSTLDAINKTKEVYQFYLTNEFFSTELSSVKHVKIQISKLQDIKDII
jgi:hypothetical protein